MGRIVYTLADIDGIHPHIGIIFAALTGYATHFFLSRDVATIAGIGAFIAFEFLVRPLAIGSYGLRLDRKQYIRSPFQRILGSLVVLIAIYFLVWR